MSLCRPVLLFTSLHSVPQNYCANWNERVCWNLHSSNLLACFLCLFFVKLCSRLLILTAPLMCSLHQCHNTTTTMISFWFSCSLLQTWMIIIAGYNLIYQQHGIVFSSVYCFLSAVSGSIWVPKFCRVLFFWLFIHCSYHCLSRTSHLIVSLWYFDGPGSKHLRIAMCVWFQYI